MKRNFSKSNTATGKTAHKEFKIKVGNDYDTATTNEEVNLIFSKLIASIVETGYPSAVIETVLEDGSAAHFGFVIWSNDGGNTGESLSLYLGAEKDTNLVRYWNGVVPNLLNMFYERWGYAPFIESPNRNDVVKWWRDGAIKNN